VIYCCSLATHACRVLAMPFWDQVPHCRHATTSLTALPFLLVCLLQRRVLRCTALRRRLRIATIPAASGAGASLRLQLTPPLLRCRAGYRAAGAWRRAAPGVPRWRSVAWTTCCSFWVLAGAAPLIAPWVAGNCLAAPLSAAAHATQHMPRVRRLLPWVSWRHALSMQHCCCFLPGTPAGCLPRARAARDNTLPADRHLSCTAGALPFRRRDTCRRAGGIRVPHCAAAPAHRHTCLFARLPAPGFLCLPAGLRCRAPRCHSALQGTATACYACHSFPSPLCICLPRGIAAASLARDLIHCLLGLVLCCLPGPPGVYLPACLFTACVGTPPPLQKLLFYRLPSPATCTYRPPRTGLPA